MKSQYSYGLRASVVIAIISTAILAQEKPCQTASKFGPNDQIGNVNTSRLLKRLPPRN